MANQLADDLELLADSYVAERGFEPRPSSSGANAQDLMTLLFAKGESRLAFKAGWEACLRAMPTIAGDDAVMTDDAVPGVGVDVAGILDDLRQVKKRYDRLVLDRKAAAAYISVIEALTATPRPASLQEPEEEKWCGECDGCGWYEGGPTIKTDCKRCNGTGKILREPASSEGAE